MTKKVCTKCHVEKDLDEFSCDKSKPDGHLPSCKVCIKLYLKENKEAINKQRAEYREKNRKKIATDQRLYVANNKEKVRDSQKAYDLKNKDKRAKSKAAYNANNKRHIAKLRRANYVLRRETMLLRAKKGRQNNKGRVNAHVALRAATKKKATPKWCEKHKIKVLYETAATMRANGVDVHVDHKVPLRSSIVCGLHCLDNLQILSAEDNLRKGNLHTP